MSQISINDIFTLANTALCVVLVALRVFWYRKNPTIERLVSQLDLYLQERVLESLRQGDTKGPPSLPAYDAGKQSSYSQTLSFEYEKKEI